MPNEHIETPFTVLIPKREEWENDTPGYAGAFNFYTDGSKLDSRVGGGVYSHELHLNLSFRLPDHCSVFQAEVLAVNEVINKLRDYRTEATDINIYSDSQAALKSLLALTTKSSSDTNCRKSLNEIAEQFDVNLIWVPGHRDIQANSIADELARRGTTDTLLPDKEGICMPLATCKLILQTHSIHVASRLWENSMTSRIAKQNSKADLA